MKTHIRALAPIFVLIPLLGGCATKLLSDDRLRTNTGGAIGVPSDELSIGNRSEQFPNTYYTVTTKAGEEYSCIINGGNVLTWGMVNPPMCNKKSGASLKSNKPAAR